MFVLIGLKMVSVKVRRALPRACQIMALELEIEQETQTTTVALKQRLCNCWCFCWIVELLLFIVQLLSIIQTIFDFRGGCLGALGHNHRVLFHFWGYLFFCRFSCTHFFNKNTHLSPNCPPKWLPNPSQTWPRTYSLLIFCTLCFWWPARCF